jgi:uncharacterized protein YbaR (Trm112 family)
MKRDFVDILVCPVCKSSLKLDVTEEKGSDIVSGSAITESIPNLLPPEV